MKKSKEKLLNNLFFLSLLKKANVILFGLLATVIIHHLLSPELKGEYAYIHNIVVTLTTILNLGINLVLPSYVRKKNDWTLSTFYILILTLFLLNFLLSLAAGIIMQDALCFLYGMAVACGVISMQVLNCTLIYDFKTTVLANIAGTVSNVVILFAALITDYENINIVFIALITKEVICSAICYFAVAKSIHLKDVKVREWKRIIIAGLIPMLTSLLSILNYKVDIMELRWLGISNHAIGIYSVGLNLAEYVLLMSDVFKDVLFHKTARDDNIQFVNRSLRFCSTLMIIVYSVIIVFGRIIIRIIYGASYVEAYAVTILVVFGTFSMMYFKLLGTLFVAQGNWNFYFFTLLGSVIINILSNLLFIPFIGIYGSALTSLLSYSFAGFAFIIKYVRTYNLSLPDILLLRREDWKDIKNAVLSLKHNLPQNNQ